MADLKAKSLQEKLGFMDNDLKTTKHDEIMLWLDQNMNTIIEKIQNAWGTKSDLEQLEKIWEFPIKSGNYIIGIIDMVVECKGPCSYKFEVKSKISSLGELIRQIQIYRSFISGTFYIVCENNFYSKILSSQGIGFIEYPSMELTLPEFKPNFNY